MKKYTIPHLKLGGTSFLLHAEYIPAVRFAAEHCEDVALLLMETGRHGELLATSEEIGEIGRIVEGEGTSLHVHLPTEADFSTPQSTRAMVGKVRRAVERAAPLHPHTFVLHVDFPELRGVLLHKNPEQAVFAEGGGAAEPGGHVQGLSEEQRGRTAEALREIAACLPSPEQLAIENLESFPTNFWDHWLDNSPYSRCLDMGHIWKDHGDPASVLTAWLPRIRVIHLHGLEPRGTEPLAAFVNSPVRNDRRGGGRPISDLLQRFGPRPRDHKSLRLMPPECLDAALHPLWKIGFTGVLNLEVFSFDDFTASHAAILQSWERAQRTWHEV